MSYWLGLSPRVRGNLLGQAAISGMHGSIPACAGEPYARRAAARPLWVFPACAGEPYLHRRELIKQSGLSPRVRGNRSRTGSGSDSTVAARFGDNQRPPSTSRAARCRLTPSSVAMSVYDLPRVSRKASASNWRFEPAPISVSQLKHLATCTPYPLFPSLCLLSPTPPVLATVTP